MLLASDGSRIGSIVRKPTANGTAARNATVTTENTAAMADETPRAYIKTPYAAARVTPGRKARVGDRGPIAP